MSNYALYPMQVGYFDSPAPRVLYLGDAGEIVPTAFMFWLVKSDERTVLVDTGFGPGDAAANLDGFRQPEDWHPLRQLAGFGVQPGDVDLIVLSHLHWDHLSDVVFEFPNARVVVQRKEFEFVTNPPHPWFGECCDQESIRRLPSLGSRFELLEGECEVAPGIRVIETPGHAFGHQSVLVETSGGLACLMVDASFFYRNLEQDIGPGFNCSLIDALASLAKLRALRDQGVIMLPGHEPEIFTRYKQRPIL